MRNAFDAYHPVVNFIFFCMVTGLGMFLVHPVFLTIGAAGAFTYGIVSGGKSTVKFSLCFLIPVTAAAAIVNPLVNHRGNTVIFYTRYSQITLEATIYGLLTGLMLATVMLWFFCYNRVMTSDKFIYLFGRIIPSTSLVFSMVLRFVPNFRTRIHEVSTAQKCAGELPESKGKMNKIKRGARILSAMFAWSLENSIDTADSMKARGYGLKNRTSFSIYRMESRDTLALAVILTTSAAAIAGAVSGACSIEYYPEIVMSPFTAKCALVYAAYAVLCFTPVLIQIKEAVLWRRSQSEI